METSPDRPRLRAREVLLAALAALALCAWPLREGLLSADRVLFGVDTATAGAPWSEAIESDAARPRNPALHDQGHAFYPFYLWVARSWLAGDPPTWNPLIYAGAPGLANPQTGAVDPQVAPLVLAYALGGRAAFDRAFAFVAWGRLAAAALGAYLLARALGLLRGPAALAGLCFGLSGYVVGWLNHSLGHVAPLLPWVLLGLEGLRGARPLRAAAGTALALALAILAGHPETAFYVGAAAGVWALALLRQDRRAGALGLAALALGTASAAGLLLPFLEYLELSGAKAIRDAELAPAGVDLIALGATVAAVGLCAWFARIQAEGAPEHGADARLDGGRVVAALGLAFALGGLTLLLTARGLSPAAALVLLPDRLGAPGDPGGYRGPGSYLEAASGWVALAALALALAAALSPRGPLARRRLVLALGAVALGLTVELPGLLDLYRHLPLVGLGATERFGAVAALMLSLAGAEALQSAPRASRLAAALCVLALGTGAALPAREAPLPEAPPEFVASEDELFGMLLAPPERLAPETLALEGWVHPAVAVERATLRLQKLDAAGRPDPESCISVPLDLFDQPSGRARAQAPERVAAAPAGAVFFRPSYVSFSYFSEGDWRFAVDLFTAGAEAAEATRVVATSRVPRPFGVRAPTLALGLLALLLIAAMPPRPGRTWQAALGAVALLQCAWFGRGLNPAVPRAECFPDTRTEAALAEVLGPYRFFSDPQVLAPDTGMVRGLAALDGYDGMDPASFNEYRHFCLPPGTNALLGWHARGVLLGAPAFRLLGVGALALRAPLAGAEELGFELFAGPGEARAAETYVYRATDPLPRALCVPRVVDFETLAAEAERGTWDPLETACIDADWRPARPFTRADVTTPTWTNARVTLEAELDGDGLLIVTDQSFPGWKATVDGEPRELVTANTLFRALPLAAGRHRIELVYAPRSLRIGTAVSAAALLGVLLLAAADGLGRGRRAGA